VRISGKVGECPHPDQTSEIGEDDRSTVESAQMKKAKKNGKRLKISEVFASELVGNHRGKALDRARILWYTPGVF
jgi:hypothetical protein